MSSSPRHPRANPLWFERDGAFNPGWFLFICFSVIGALLALGALVLALLVPAAWPVAIAALSFIAFAMLCTAMIVVPIARAKLLAPALKGAAEGISHVAPPFAGMDVSEAGAIDG